MPRRRSLPPVARRKAPEDDYQEFCPNEGLLSVLPRQSNVTRPYGPE